MIPNLLWTVLFLIPITLFCYNFVAPKMTYIFLGVSLIPIFFPNSFFDSIQYRQKDFANVISTRMAATNMGIGAKRLIN